MNISCPYKFFALCQNIIKHGFATGSRKFGVQLDDSDYDFVMTYDAAHILFDDSGVPLDIPVEIQDYAGRFVSLKYEYNDEWVNLIIVPTEVELDAWKYATEQMLMMDKELIKVKKERTKYFGWLLTEHFFYTPKGKHFEIAMDVWGTGTIPRDKRG